MNSKLKNVDDNKSSNSDSPPAPVSGGLKLFDLATIKEAIAQNSSNKIEDDERNARQMRSIVHVSESIVQNLLYIPPLHLLE